MKTRPEKITIGRLIRAIWKRGKEKRHDFKFKVQVKMGAWYCTHCGKMHGKHIVRYLVLGIDDVCSLGKTEYLKNDHAECEEEQYRESDFLPYYGGLELTDKERGGTDEAGIIGGKRREQ